MGLALSKSLAPANGSDLTLISGPGEGARFVFTLPVTASTDVVRRHSPTDTTGVGVTS